MTQIADIRFVATDTDTLADVTGLDRVPLVDVGLRLAGLLDAPR